MYDYLTATCSRDTPEGSATLSEMLALARIGRPWTLYGFDGYLSMDGSVFIGHRVNPTHEHDQPRVLINVAGAQAASWLAYVLSWQELSSPSTWAVTRVDVQTTHQLPVSPSEYLLGLRPSPRYSAMTIRSLGRGAEGSGWYVGSSRSDARMRVYDKSAQLAARLPELPDGSHNLLRIEMIYRRDRAQRVLEAAISPSGDAQVLSLYWNDVLARIPELRVLEPGCLEKPVRVPRSVNRDAAAYRRERWLCDVVAPSVARHYAADPEGFASWLERVHLELVRNAQNREHLVSALHDYLEV